MKTKIWAAMLAVYIIWGSTYLGIRFAIETIPPFLQAGVRFLLSGLILYIWRRKAGDPAPTPKQWLSALIVGSLLLVGGNGLISLAELQVPSGIAALIVATIPMFMVLIEAIRPGGVKPTPMQIFSLMVGFSGVALLISPTQPNGKLDFNLLAGGLVLFAAFLWSLGSIYSRNADLPESTLIFSGMEMLAGSIGLLLLSFARGELVGFHIADVSTRSLLGFLYLVTFGSLIAFTSYAWLLKNAPLSLISTYPYVNPIVAVLLGTLFGKEELNPRIILASVIIVGSVILINRFSKPDPGKES